MHNNTIIDLNNMLMDNTNDLLMHHYIIIEKIGSGSFGDVYLGEDGKNMKYALKIENKYAKKTRLIKEYTIYKQLIKQRMQNIPKIYKFIKTTNNIILVMELLGPNLEELLIKYNKKFDTMTILKLSIAIISIIEKLHDVGYIHRDIKPNNFLIGRNNNKDIIYLMDFGLSKKYITNGKHIQMSTINNIIGTPRYASVNVHNNMEPSRRDDLESIGYMLIYLAKGTLPWKGIRTKKTMKKQIGDMKKNIKLTELTKELPKCFYSYMKYVKKLAFDEDPNYECIKSMFTEYINLDDNKYIWEHK